MATATIVKVFPENGKLIMVVSVNEGAAGVRQYVGKVPIDDLVGKTNAEKKDALTAAVKLNRDAQLSSLVAPPVITGTVTI